MIRHAKRKFAGAILVSVSAYSPSRAGSPSHVEAVDDRREFSTQSNAIIMNPDRINWIPAKSMREMTLPASSPAGLTGSDYLLTQEICAVAASLALLASPEFIDI